MQRHKLGSQAGGVAGMKGICDILQAGVDPRSTPVEYEVIGADLDSKPIEAGLGSFEWLWDELSQEDYGRLIYLQGDVAGASMYVRTSKKAGASGIDFANFLVVMHRPAFEERRGLICYNVRIPFSAAQAA